MTRALAVLAALGLWAAVTYGNVRVQFVNPVLLPTPVDVAKVGLATVQSGELGWHVVTSLGRVAEGFGIAVLAALGLGILAGLCVPLRLMVEPVIDRKSVV